MRVLQAAGGTVPESEELLEEVANLVEAPTVVCGEFSTEFLRLPIDLLVKTMRKHQRYFPVYSPDAGQLMNRFITVANGDVDVDVVRRGNEDVLRARFEDASFFYDEDLKSPLESFLPALKGTMFHNELGRCSTSRPGRWGWWHPLRRCWGCLLLQRLRGRQPS